MKKDRRKMMYSVILVDDEYWALKSNKNTFNWGKYDFNVIGETTDSEEAIEMILEKNPDVVFLDINMPGISGLELIDRVNSPKRIRYVIISAYRDFEYAKRAITLDVFEYCVKPVREAEADRVLDRLKTSLDMERNIINIDDLLSKYNFENRSINNVMFKKMIKYIFENSSRKLNLNTLAEMFSLNPNYCSSLFRRYFDCGFSEYVTQIRILNAATYVDYETEAKRPAQTLETGNISVAVENIRNLTAEDAPIFVATAPYLVGNCVFLQFYKLQKVYLWK